MCMMPFVVLFNFWILVFNDFSSLIIIDAKLLRIGVTPNSLRNEYSCEYGSILIQSIIGNWFHSRRLATDGKWSSQGLYLRFLCLI